MLKCSGFFAVIFLFSFLVFPLFGDQTVNLQPGFNFIGLLAESDSATSDKLFEGNTPLQSIFRFNTATQSFEFQLKLSSGDLFGNAFPLIAGEGYVFKATSSYSHTFTGNEPSSIQQISLSDGFTFAAIPTIPTLRNSDSLLSSHAALRSIFLWDVSDQTFDFNMRLDSGMIFGEALNFSPGDACFFRGTAGGTIYYSTEFIGADDQIIIGPYGVISGTILHPVTKEPVPSATVTLHTSVSTNINAAPTRTAIKNTITRAPLDVVLTDEAGRYEFQEVIPGNYNLAIDKDGRFGTTIPVVVRQGLLTSIENIELKPILTVRGTIRIDSTVLEYNEMPQILVWILGTSFGTVPEALPQTDPSFRDYQFSISNVPVHNTPYSIQYFAENHLTQTNSLSLPVDEIPLNFTKILPLVTLTGQAVNQIPIAVLTTSSTSVSAGNSIILDGSTSRDPDGDPITYHWSQTAGPAVTIPAATSTVEVTLSQSGDYGFMLIVADDHRNTSLPALVTVSSMAITNAPPVAMALLSVNGAAGTVQAIAEAGSIITLNGAGSSDAENNTLAYRWLQTGGPSVSFASSGTSQSTQVTDSFTIVRFGTYRFALIVNDGTTDSAASHVTVDVISPLSIANQPPNGIATTSTNEVALGVPVTLDASGSTDPENDTLTHQWIQVGGPSAGISNNTAVSPTITTTGRGLHIFQLIVNDGYNNDPIPAYVSFNVVQYSGTPPTAVTQVLFAGSPVSNVAEGSLVTLDGSLSSDPEGQPLLYFWEQTSGPTVTIATPLAASPTVTLTNPGAYSFQLTVNDGIYTKSAFAIIEATETLVVPAGIPVAVTSADTTSVQVGTLVTLDGTASSDPTSQPITYIWTQVSGPTVALSSSTIVQPTFTIPSADEYLFQLIVNNGQNNSLASFITVHGIIVANVAPVAAAQITAAGSPVAMVQPNTAIILDATASVDSDNSPAPLSYNWIQLSGPAVTLSNAATATAGVTVTLSGHYTFKLTVNDGLSLHEAYATLTVNAQPTAFIEAPDTVMINQVVNLSGAASSDPDGGNLTYSWQQRPGNPEVITFGSGGTGVNDSFTPGEIGTYRIQLVVSDGSLSSATSEVSISVVAPPLDSTKISVNQNNPTVDDTVTGVAGALSGGGFTIRAYRDVTLTQPLKRPGPITVEAVTAADGSFSLNLGDNNINLTDNLFYIAVVGTTTKGQPLELTNDVTHPASPIIDRIASDASIISANQTAVTITGSAEPGVNVGIFLKSFSPVVIAGPYIIAANATTGSFTISADATTLPEGNLVVEAQLTDLQGNSSPNFPLFTMIKDTILPTVTVTTPITAGYAKATPELGFSLSEEGKNMTVIFTDTGNATTHTFTTDASAFLTTGSHEAMPITLDSPLVDGRNYNFTITVEDLAGNTGITTLTNITCDTSAPTGITLSQPANSSVVAATIPHIEYDLTAVSEPITSGFITITQDGGDADANSPYSYTFSSSELTSASHTIDLNLATPLQNNSTYTWEFTFQDAAGNSHTLLTSNGVLATDGSQYAGFSNFLPVSGTTMAPDPRVAYLLGEDVLAVHFEYVKIAGSGVATRDVIVTTAGLVTAGMHETTLTSGTSFTNGDEYNLVVKLALTGPGPVVEVARITNLTVDATPANLTSVTAIQAIFGEWTAGDSVIIEFDKSMYNGWKYSIETATDMNSALVDSSGNAGDDWGSGIVSWDTTHKIMTFLLSSNQFGGTPFLAGNSVAVNSQVEPSTLFDGAGNAMSGSPQEMISTGDVTPPVLIISNPVSGGFVPPNPVLLYHISENLKEGTLQIELVKNYETTEVIVFREWSLDAARRSTGNNSIDIVSEGLPPLNHGNEYRFTISGIDGLGNQSSQTIASVFVDGLVPASPNPDYLYVKNHSGKLYTNPEVAIGTNNERLRLYVDGVLTAEAAYPGPYGDVVEVAVISGLAPIASGSAIQYSLVDAAGNESTLASDGTMHAPPSGAHLSAIGLRSGTTDFQVNNATGMEANCDLYVDLNQNNNDVTYVGWTDGAGNCNPSTNAIDKANVAVGDAVYYIYSTSTTGHYSVHSAQDGVVVGLSSVAIIDNDLMGNISPNDSLEITFTGNVDIPISSSAISGGQALLGAGNYQWNAVLQDINVAPVSVGSAAVINGEGFWLKNSTNSNKVYIDLNFANHSVGVIQQYQVEIKPNGTNTILSSSGGHCVLPKTTITASGTTGGERTPDF